MPSEPLKSRRWSRRPRSPLAGLPRWRDRRPHPSAGRCDCAAEAFYGDLLGFDVTCRYPGASFFGSGGYHHQIATNIWSSRNASPRLEPVTGLGTLRVLPAGDRPIVDATVERLAAASIATTPLERGFAVRGTPGALSSTCDRLSRAGSPTSAGGPEHARERPMVRPPGIPCRPRTPRAASSARPPASVAGSRPTAGPGRPARWISAEPGRYHLYVVPPVPGPRARDRACLKRLDRAVTVTVLEPALTDQGWRFGDDPICHPDSPTGGPICTRSIPWPIRASPAAPRCRCSGFGSGKRLSAMSSADRADAEHRLRRPGGRDRPLPGAAAGRDRRAQRAPVPVAEQWRLSRRLRYHARGLRGGVRPSLCDAGRDRGSDSTTGVTWSTIG